MTDPELLRSLSVDVGMRILESRGYLPSHIKHMGDSWYDEEGERKVSGGVGTIELYRFTRPTYSAVLVFRPKDMTIGWDIEDH